MKAARIHEFGPPSVIVIEDLPRPTSKARRSPCTRRSRRRWTCAASQLRSGSAIQVVGLMPQPPQDR
jgi:hypothetical protein